jgi:hypothetical protein
MIKTMQAIFISLLLLVGFSTSACAQDVEPPVRKQIPKAPTPTPKPIVAPTPKLAPDRSKFAVIINGIGGEEAYTKQFTTWTSSLYTALTEKLGFEPEQIYTLVEKPTGKQLLANAEEVRKTFATLSTSTKADSPLYIFLIGHGSSDGKEAKFMMVGPDLTATEYGRMIKALPTRKVTIINMASASGDFIKPLTGAGYLTITATRSGQEQNATRFPEFFIAALTNPEADTDKNGRVSVLEAFEYTVKLTDDWYKQQGRLVTEHALLDDNGDGVGHQKVEAGDGALAKTTYFDSLPRQQAGGDLELAKLYEERLRLEGAIEQLKARKDQTKPEEYEAALEKLLIELATLNQQIRAKQK